MSFARGDLARRAALADNLAVPEPWGANDDPRVFSAIRDLRDEFRQLGITDADGKGRLPDFLIDYENLPAIKPVALDRAHTRNSSATRWDQNGNLVEEPSDTLRLQRDPATQEVEGLLYEPKRIQKFTAPTDLSNSAWVRSSVSLSTNVGTAKGLQFDSLTENTANSLHGVLEQFDFATDQVVAFSAIVKSDGQDFCALRFRNSNGTQFFAWFDIISGLLGTEEFSGTAATLIDHSIEDLGGGWYRVKLVAKPSSGNFFDDPFLILANGDGVRQYTGDGTSGIFVMHTQAEVSREVTTPILTGNATRGADAVDYRFSFPDTTTGVAYSIKETGNAMGNTAFQMFGTTPDTQDELHGVLMDTAGNLNRVTTSGFKRVTRNSNEEDGAGGVDPDDETIDRFQTTYSKNGQPQYKHKTRTVRQIAIHTQPHTQTQKSALADQYLTQP